MQGKECYNQHPHYINAPSPHLGPESHVLGVTEREKSCAKETDGHALQRFSHHLYHCAKSISRAEAHMLRFSTACLCLTLHM